MKQGSTPIPASSPGRKTGTVTFVKSKNVVLKVVCLTLLALTAAKSYSQEPFPRDFDARISQLYGQIVKPEITFQQYLTLSKAEFQRQAQLRTNPRLKYQPVIGQSTPCGNGDFETGLNPAQWQGAYGTVPSNGDPDFATFTTGIVGGAINLSTSHQTVVVAPGLDPTVGISLTAPGSTRAVRIGNAVNGRGSELLSKTFHVPAAGSLISFWYAVVFQDPGHLLFEQPSFWVRVTDTATGLVIPNVVNLGNGTSKIVADSTNPFFQTKPGTTPVLYRDWSCAQINLSQQIGKTVTIEFVTEDCTLGGHYGYAYIDNFCGSCAGSPTGDITFDPKGSSACGPGKICFNYSLPKVTTPAGTLTGNVKISLDIYQNGVFVASLPASPTLTSGTKYCFNITAAFLAGLPTGVGYFDFVATAAFTFQNTTLPPMVVGAAPAGRLTGFNNDYKITCGPPIEPKFCCPGPNLLVNGDFELGNAGFISQYTFKPMVNPVPLVPLGAIVPGQYGIVKGTQALTISPNWVAADHSSCNAASGQFMVVNGKTTQSGSKSIWKQTVAVTGGKEYRFCANVKNLKQCTFDIKPIISVQFSVPNSFTPTVVNVTGSGACDWQLISGSIAVPAGTSSLTINILLDETGLGDGNDLALDDISLQEKTEVDPSLVLININAINTVAGQYKVIATYPTGLPGYPYGYLWQVCELDASNNCISTTTVANPSQWWTYDPNNSATFTNNFSGYHGTSSLNLPANPTDPTNPGVFLTTKRYRIIFGVWSDCKVLRISSWLLQFSPSLKVPQVSPLQVRAQDVAKELPLPSLPLESQERSELRAERLEQAKLIKRPVLLGYKEAMQLPRAEDDTSSVIAVASPSIEAGQQAPDFAVKDSNGKTWRLSDLRYKKNVLLTFFPKCFTGGCANHLSSLRDRQGDFDAAETQILAVSVDSADGERGQVAFARQWQLSFPLVPDTERRLSMLYGAVQNDKQLASRMSVFIDKQGVVQFVDTNVNVFTHGADITNTIAKLHNHQYKQALVPPLPNSSSG